jgi:hypothetical protein
MQILYALTLATLSLVKCNNAEIVSAQNPNNRVIRVNSNLTAIPTIIELPKPAQNIALQSTISTSKPRRPLPASKTIVNPHDFKYTILERDICSKNNDAFVLVIVHSAPDHFKRRAFIRQTWGSRKFYDRLKMTIVFTMGVVGGAEKDKIQTMIAREHELYRDIIQVSASIAHLI